MPPQPADLAPVVDPETSAAGPPAVAGGAAPRGPVVIRIRTAEPLDAPSSFALPTRRSVRLRPPPSDLVLLTVLTIVGLVALVVQLRAAWHDHELLADLSAHGTPAMAQVVAVESNRGLDHATVRYTVGQHVEQRRLGFWVTSSVDEGDAVRIIYDPEQPGRVALASWVNGEPMWWDLAGAATGAVCAVVGVIGLARRRPGARL
ncbi:hypothetical protein BCD48_31235 [Pseudofrankia sp. BMG5.36]|nr:hypothetical protein BCD48_31235 [Pseudofrankia sp. BMG5.36]